MRVTYEWVSGIRIFLVGYLNSFNISDLSTNYLGDPGRSVSYPPSLGENMEVIVPNGNSLVLAFSTVEGMPVGSAGTTVKYLVEGFGPIPTPEPTTMLLLGLGLMGLAGVKRFNE